MRYVLPVMIILLLICGLLAIVVNVLNMAKCYHMEESYNITCFPYKPEASFTENNKVFVVCSAENGYVVKERIEK